MIGYEDLQKFFSQFQEKEFESRKRRADFRVKAWNAVHKFHRESVNHSKSSGSTWNFNLLNFDDIPKSPTFSIIFSVSKRIIRVGEEKQPEYRISINVDDHGWIWINKSEKANVIDMNEDEIIKVIINILAQYISERISEIGKPFDTPPN